MPLPDVSHTDEVPEAWTPEPGAAQRRDDALNRDPAVVVPPPLPPSAEPTESERAAAEDIAASIAEARARAGIDGRR